MIDEEITYTEKGYRSGDLCEGSHKKVWAVCDECDSGRWIEFRQYRELCFVCAKRKSRKYDHDDSENTIRNIDEEKTFMEKGYRSDTLSTGSHKKVLAICTECGKGRWLAFKQYNDLCKVCSCRSDEARRRNSESRKGKKLSEEHKRKIGEYRHTEEAKRQMSESRKGKNNSNWKGGISFEPYCEKFDEKFKEFIREKFGRVCFICGKNEKDNGQKLSVHHVNYDKECICNGVECEFVPLCMRCHTITNGDRDSWERLIMNVLSYEGWI